MARSAYIECQGPCQVGQDSETQSGKLSPVQRCQQGNAQSYEQNQGGNKIRLKKLSNYEYIYIQTTQKTQ